jgi:hypothetical protein
MFCDRILFLGGVPVQLRYHSPSMIINEKFYKSRDTIALKCLNHQGGHYSKRTSGMSMLISSVQYLPFGRDGHQAAKGARRVLSAAGRSRGTLGEFTLIPLAPSESLVPKHLGPRLNHDRPTFVISQIPFTTPSRELPNADPECITLHDRRVSGAQNLYKTDSG